jgi:calcineurin-like phosphoesterase
MKGLQTNPFISLQKVVDNDTSDIHIVDFHCETTSEKNALLLTFASKVSAILGTHTHIQTNDNIIYHDTAYITDTGSCCGSEGIIGANAAPILDVYNERSSRFKMEPSATKYKFNAVVLSFDDVTNLPLSIEKINIIENKK